MISWLLQTLRLPAGSSRPWSRLDRYLQFLVTVDGHIYPVGSTEGITQGARFNQPLCLLNGKNTIGICYMIYSINLFLFKIFKIETPWLGWGMRLGDFIMGWGWGGRYMFNSLDPDRCGNNFSRVIVKLIGVSASCEIVSCLMPENPLLLISKHWFRWWLDAVRQQAITWANVDPGQYRQNRTQWIQSDMKCHCKFQVWFMFYLHIAAMLYAKSCHIGSVLSHGSR